jgi:Na+/H+ antiporter NhaD/arsenite permease-like protein
MLVFIPLLGVLFRKALQGDPARSAELMLLDEREALEPGPLLTRSLVVLGAVTLGFAFHSSLHYEPSVVAMIGAGVLLLVAGRPAEQFLREVEWRTLVFFMGLFVMVGALVKTGAVARLAEAAVEVTGESVFVGSMLLIWVSAALSALVDNIPYVATMAPLVTELINGLPAGTDSQPLWWSLALGADYGGNATPIGASANVVVIGMALRAGWPISFKEFVKYGLVVTLVTVAIATGYVWLRYFVLSA